MVLDEDFSPIKVGIDQFYGIEINDFAVTVAKTALWIAESQMMKETEDILLMSLDFLPLKTNAYIIEKNALDVDWNEIIDKKKLSFMIGNPPFRGMSYQTDEQKQDIARICPNRNIDYVSCWYYKAIEYIQNTSIKCAFVSTSSITQGEQVEAVWQPLYKNYKLSIDFAYREFKWSSEASLKAQVYCVIIGFSANVSSKEKNIYVDSSVIKAKNINPYLIDGDIIFIESRKKPLSEDTPILQNGGKPTEGGFLILSETEKEELVKKNPAVKQFLRPYMMGKDFIERKPRYCIWLVNANPTELKKCPEILERVQKVRDYRANSKKAATRKKAETPTLFDEVRECSFDYVAIPKVSGGNRRYIPMDYLSKDIIPGDKLFMIQNSSLYLFGVLMSNVHMSWMRLTASYLSTSYSYSSSVVYNNFPWPKPSEEQKNKISETAQAILNARALYPNSSLADLYDPLTMPVELKKAHIANDKAVMQAYGLSIKDTSEADCVAALLKMYQDLTK